MTPLVEPTIGRIVHYRIRAGGPCQAAIVVKVWSPETLNLVVFRDGSNDRGVDGHADELTYWATSSTKSRGPDHVGSWHWPTEGCPEER